MSNNSSSTSPKEDRRVVRTRDRLGDALVELLIEKPFDDVTVQEVLDRARVSRSTFYQHYRDKNDLFLSDVDDFFEKMASLLTRRDDRSERVAPVAELFAHVAEVQDVRELGEAHFARGIERRLGGKARAGVLQPEICSALAHSFAGSLFALLNWWLLQRMPKSAREMDDLFHGIVSRGLSSTKF